MWLVKHNVPFDVAFQMDDVTRTAMCIVLAEMEGGEFDWDSMCWKEPSNGT
ncbi:hypothetical protein LJR084_001924 [Variovorax sp. LjRoot84]|uniref:hypothetical protein n=1 Tax=Variovorax sp. LjRoot84 TaxID=3342340 RepID=UPI003ECE0380